MKLLILSTLAATLPALAANYFPLNAGNQWTLTNNRGGQMEIRVGLNYLQDGDRTFLRVFGYQAQPVWVHALADGDLLWRNMETETVELLTSFSTERGVYPSPLGACPQFARVERELANWGKAGQQMPALRIHYEGGCPDNAITEELYVANVGLVRRVVSTIAGPVAYDLTRATVGSLIFVNQSGAFLDLSLPSTSWTLDEGRFKTRIQLRLESRSSEPLRLRFPDGQRYEFLIRDTRGNVVWRWSEGRYFIQAAAEELIVNRTWAEDIDVRVPGPGEYRLEGRLTTWGDPVLATAVTIRAY